MHLHGAFFPPSLSPQHDGGFASRSSGLTTRSALLMCYVFPPYSFDKGPNGQVFIYALPFVHVSHDHNNAQKQPLPAWSICTLYVY